MKERYYLVREDILPEAVVKTMQVKKLLASGDVRTVHEAVEQVGLSRSAFTSTRTASTLSINWNVMKS